MPVAEALAARFGLPLRPATVTETWALWLTPERLELHQRQARRTQVLAVDFAAEALSYRRSQPGFNEALAKAVGVQASQSPQVLDATAGWGRDAFLLAHWGCTVVMLEQHPAVAALLADGLCRAQQLAALAPVAARLSLVWGDALSYLPQLAAPVDVVYLDPMFPSRRKAALARQEMQALQALVGSQEMAALWTLARAHARRVVIKRPSWTAPTAVQPTFTVGQGAVRFEVFLGGA